MKTLLPVMLFLAACAAPPPALVNAHQAAFDREPDLAKKREILELQQKAVQRMVETRNAMRELAPK